MKTLQEREWFFSQEREEFVSRPPRIIYNPDPHYNMYRLKTTRQLVGEITLDLGLGLDRPYEIGAVADLHFNFCNIEDREDEELAYTEVCRQWLKESKSLPAAIKALEGCDFLDATVVLGDTLDYLSSGSAELTKTHIIKKYPDAMIALGGHDYTKEMQTGKPDLLPLEERLNSLREFWPHDIHYYSRDLGNKIVAVVLDNSQSRYLPEEVDKLRSDIDRARSEGKVILIFQHEPILSNNPNETNQRAVIENSGAWKTIDLCARPDIIGGADRFDDASRSVYELITKNADVVKAIFAGHWHSQFYSEVLASYEKDGETVKAVIPQYVISGNPYHEAGMFARIIVK